jgi:hypothetical protein
MKARPGGDYPILARSSLLNYSGIDFTFSVVGSFGVPAIVQAKFPPTMESSSKELASS